MPAKKPTKQTPKKFLRNVRFIGAFLIFLGIGFAALFSFDIIAVLIASFYVSVGVVCIFYPRAVKEFIIALVTNLPMW